jgi:hypothetical protein
MTEIRANDILKLELDQAKLLGFRHIAAFKGSDEAELINALDATYNKIGEGPTVSSDTAMPHLKD